MNITIPWLNKKKIHSGRVGVAVGPDGIAVAHTNAQGVTDFCEFYADAGNGEQLFSTLVNERNWQGKPTSLVLHPLYYQLTLAETPPVPAEEMADAVRWRLKEFVDYPLEEAAVDYFQLPEDAYRGRKSMLYAAVMRKNHLSDIAQPLEQSELELDCIEVSELAVHNLSHALPETRGGTALVHLLEHEGFINLIEDGNIYLSRKFDIGTASFEPGQDNLRQQENLLLEIQRSLDFYESQLGKGIISDLYYSPARADMQELGDFLALQLGLNVAPLDLKAMLTTEYEPDELVNCLSAIGASLGPQKNTEALDAAH